MRSTPHGSIGRTLAQVPSRWWKLLRRNTTTRARTREQLLHLATHDVVTGLPNRSLFLKRLARALARPDAGTQAVLFIDLDDFKDVNDQLGHRIGDAVLSIVGRRLSACLQTGELAARFGGDEFLVLLECANPQGGALEAGERIISALQQPLTVDGHRLAITASIGIAERTPLHTWPTEILREADVALYQAKRAGRARAVIFDPSMNVRAVERLDLEEDLARAIERDQLYLEYQPEVDLRTGATLGVEALLRWRHHERGVIQPDELIPMAEDTGLILGIGAWVLEEACRQAQSWHAELPHAPIHMSVNLSARQLGQSGLVEDVARILRETGMAPASLRLEITESALVQCVESGNRTLAALQEMGVRLSLDDFGTGYSSLTYLRQFPLDALKLDRSFVRGLDTEQKTRSIVEAVIALARALEIDVTAEGVETSSQAEQLVELGCVRAQGFYFARPQAAERIMERLRADALHLDPR